jgi:hypothetical protein
MEATRMAKDSRPPRLIRSWVTCQAPNGPDA